MFTSVPDRPETDHEDDEREDEKVDANLTAKD
jgi:hypothetical protein